ncbi:HNH endonuclease signature motif containing protein [Ruegeria sp. EL01]|uniref:HNH endonuclease signature motif containing protein n=1 Tax=Ruegeria sp. EL01 TaxID=2107578 RepID=UPI000EA82E84|nr:HNH endonuclease signature motif containing protein [Ruegeria sp. EL01]
MNRKSLPKKLEKEIYQQFQSQCPFCGESDVNTLQVHHIVPHAQVQAHHVKNLLLTCANCHQKIENDVIAQREVYEAKFDAERAFEAATEQMQKDAGSVVSFSGTNTGVVANTVNMTTKSSSVKQGPIPGTIGAELELRNYAKHLIDRYREFKEADVGKGAMRHAVLYSSIKRKFGAKWDHIPAESFENLAAFLRERIDGTRLGKTQKARGQKNYSSFEEHRTKPL